MPPYATVADVVQLNTGRPFTASSKPTASQVIDFLEQTAAVIDGLLRERRYALPIPTTATSALKALEHFNAVGAHCKVEQGAQHSDRRDSAGAMWEMAQKMLRDGVIELDAPRDAVGGMPRSGGAATPFFTRDLET